MVASRALRTLQICASALMIAAVVIACTPPADDIPVETGIVSPYRVYRGTSALVALQAQGLNFSRCENLKGGPTALPSALNRIFSFHDGESGQRLDSLSVASVESVGPALVEMTVTVGQNAPDDVVELRFRCDTDRIIRAQMDVRSSAPRYSLVFSPDELYAGQDRQTVTVTRVLMDGTPSDEPDVPGLPTSVVLEKDAQVTVGNISRSDDPESLTISFDLDPAALPVGELSSPLIVNFVYPTDVYSGVLTILPDNSPYVTATPTRLYKPKAGDGPLSASISLKVASLFAESESLDSSRVTVSVPENPGVQLADTGCIQSGSDPDSIECPFVVDNSASLGPTAVQVQVGDITTYASVSVLPMALDDRIVRFWPDRINTCNLESCAEKLSENCRCPAQTVVAEMVGPDVSSDWSARLIGDNAENAELVSAQLVANDHWILSVRVPHTGEASGIGVEFVSGDGEQAMQGWLLLRDIGDVGAGFREIYTASKVDQTFVKRGEKPYSQRLKLQDTSFQIKDDSATGREALSTTRGGISLSNPISFTSGSMKTSGLWGGQGFVLDEFQVITEAPVGPAILRVTGESALADNDVWLKIVPGDGDTGVIFPTPDIIWLNRPTATVVFTASGDMALNSNTRFHIADPAISIQSVAFAEDSITGVASATVTLKISPAATAGLKTFYLSNADGSKAAVNIRGVKKEQFTVPRVEQSLAIYRSVGKGRISIQIKESMHNAPVALSIPTGIGATVDRYSTRHKFTLNNSNVVLSQYVLEVVFSLEAKGPGGWIGVSVNAGGERFVIPVKIVAETDSGEEDNSLTATLSRENIVPGSRDVTDLNIFIPQSMTRGDTPVFLGSVMSEVHTLDNNVYARLAEIPTEGGNSLRMAADFAYTLDLPADDRYPGVPISVSASEGAIVGFWDILPDDLIPQFDDDTFEIEADYSNIYTASEGGRTLIRGKVSPHVDNSWPASLIQIRGSRDWSEQYESVPLSLVSMSQIEAFPSIAAVESEEKSIVTEHSAAGLLYGVFREKELFKVSAEYSEPYKINLLNITPGDTVLSGNDLCQVPSFYVDKIQIFSEHDRFALPATAGNCRVAAVISARTLMDTARYTPDVTISACNGEWNCDALRVDDTADGGSDPIMYFNSGEYAGVQVESRMASIGFYTLNLRQPEVIYRVSAETGNQYIELQMEPGASMDNCLLARLDPESTDDVLLVEQALSGVVPEDGRVFVGNAAFGFVDVGDENRVTDIGIEDDFKLRLTCSGRVADRFQVGGVSVVRYLSPTVLLEGPHLKHYKAPCYMRIGNGIDTNRNDRDIVPSTNCTVLN